MEEKQEKHDHNHWKTMATSSQKSTDANPRAKSKWNYINENDISCFDGIFETKKSLKGKIAYSSP